RDALELIRTWSARGGCVDLEDATKVRDTGAGVPGSRGFIHRAARRWPGRPEAATGLAAPWEIRGIGARSRGHAWGPCFHGKPQLVHTAPSVHALCGGGARQASADRRPW